MKRSIARQGSVVFVYCLAAMLCWIASAASAADRIRTQRVQFKPGTSTATIEAAIQGDQIVVYDQSQADRGVFKARREGDTTVVEIGEKRYELPDAIVQGG